jgi:hypothetical protein
MTREAFLQWIHLVIPFTSLMQDHIDDLVVFADIFGGCRHDLIHDLAEQEGITTRVVPYSGNQLCDCLFVLKEAMRYKHQQR